MMAELVFKNSFTLVCIMYMGSSGMREGVGQRMESANVGVFNSGTT